MGTQTIVSIETAETEQKHDPWLDHRDAFVLRQTPLWCLPGAPTPDTWTAGASAWAELAAESRLFAEAKARTEFTAKIAEQGFFPDELGSGELRPGAEVFLASGRIKRPPQPNLSAETRAACRRVLEEAARLRVELAAPIAIALEQASIAGVGPEDDVVRKLKAAQDIVVQVSPQIEAESATERSKPRLRVLRAFSCMGHTYAPGEYALTMELAESLLVWQMKMEAEGKRRQKDAPIGYSATTWPPFELYAHSPSVDKQLAEMREALLAPWA